MSSPNQQLQEMVRQERLRVLRVWFFGLGVLALVAALGAFGFGGPGNPKTASSAYATFAVAGLLHSLIKPLTMFGVSAIIGGAIISAFLRGKQHGI